MATSYWAIGKLFFNYLKMKQIMHSIKYEITLNQDTGQIDFGECRTPAEPVPFGFKIIATGNYEAMLKMLRRFNRRPFLTQKYIVNFC